MLKRMVAATITNEQAQDAPRARQVINDTMVANVITDFEDQLINGDGNHNEGNLQGLFYKPAAAWSDNAPYGQANDPFYKQEFNRGNGEDANDLLDFYLRALTAYIAPRPGGTRDEIADANAAGGAGRMPTHILMPYQEKMRLMSVTDKEGRYMWANTVQGDFLSLWGLPILVSDYVPEERGAIVAIDDMAIVIRQGMEWSFGLNGYDMVRDQTTMAVRHRAAFLVKRPKSIMLLGNLSGK